MKKGFTLIELLAVIVILAIIAIIAVPTISNVVSKARKGAAEASALNYIDAVEKYMILHDMNPTKYPYDIKGGTFNVASNTEVSLIDLIIPKAKAEETIPSLNSFINVKGDKPKSGTITTNEKGKVTEADIVIKGYTVECTGSSCEANSGTGFTVTYNSNGGTGSMESSLNSVSENGFIAPGGKVFKEWNTKADGSGDTYTTNSEVSSKLTLYAIWKSKVYTLAQEVLYNPVTNKACDTEGGDCYKWRVITIDDDETKDTITLQMNHNLVNTSDWASKADYNDDTNYGTNGNTNKGPITILKGLSTATSNWNDSLLLNYTYDSTVSENNYGVLTCTNGSCSITGNNTPIATGIKARIITAEEVAAIAKNKFPSFNWTYSSGTSVYFANTRFGYSSTDLELSWLIENTSTYSYSGANTNTYDLGNYGYWTFTTHNTASTAFSVSYAGDLNPSFIKNANWNIPPYGIRPVIEVDKSIF